MSEHTHRSDNPLRFLYLASVFRPVYMNALLRYAEQTGFGQATFVDGAPRDNVQTVFFDRTQDYPLGPIFDRVIELSKYAGKMFNIEVTPEQLSFMQVARYLPGDHYGTHTDHDSSLLNLDYDRKLSFFCSMSDGGQLLVDRCHLNVGLGDVVIFPATMEHAAPQQHSGSRYSFVCWMPGPTWK
ncbi:MAG: 2OG-Fe(II) oxygenase [Gemmatimonadetes bacterium]|nr:2OG-Fe(II) oxygenase [Gemmatimonadota bacterium]